MRRYYYNKQTELLEYKKQYFKDKYNTDDKFKESKQINATKNYYNLTNEEINLCENNYENVRRYMLINI